MNPALGTIATMLVRTQGRKKSMLVRRSNLFPRFDDESSFLHTYARPDLTVETPGGLGRQRPPHTERPS